uniref:Plastidal glycolate/glycerate translocator 1, chloroplastic n=1 Tax=Corethron hystrix TaxID=216773 RepID=A0A7S1BPN4_9STRA|mmetsp:Transcript_33757/g.77924  ORF Transcript_33757/g.77924 Transcript_33757/m.77924 type:complete len:512 (+) Transcript_33757:75-1610(+)
MTNKSVTLLLALTAILLTLPPPVFSSPSTTAASTRAASPHFGGRPVIPSKTSSSLVLQEDDGSQVTASAIVSPPRGGAVSSLLPNSPQALYGAVFYIVFDVGLRKLFKKLSISFPSMMAGCVGLFVAMVLAEVVSPGSGDAVFDSLSPGSAFLTKWMPAFFVPGLVMLPLAPSMGSPLEVAKVLLVVVGGFFFSLSTVAFSVLGLRKLQGADTSIPGQVAASTGGGDVKPYSAETAKFLTTLSLILFPITLGCTLSKNSAAPPVQTAFLAASTLCTFVYGARLPASFVKIVHPLIMSTTLTLLTIKVLSACTGNAFGSILSAYKSGKMSLANIGAGDILLFLLGPSVQSFSIAMYSRKGLMKDNLLVVAVAALVSAGGGLFATAAFVRFLKIANDVIRISSLPRNVTTALAMAISQILGGDIAITASVVVLTGVFAATVGGKVLTAMGLVDPISRGLAIGSAGQGLGVASFAKEKDAFPFAAIAMICTAITATCLASVPAVKDAILGVTIG